MESNNNVETVETGLASGAPNVAADAPTEADKAEEKAADEAKGEKKLSAFKQRQLEKGRDSFIVEGPQELVDMMRAAAHAQDDMSVASWVRLALCEAVNAANLTHEVTTNGTTTTEAWQFDKDGLEVSRQRRSTAHMSPEEKEKAKEAKKVEQKEERELIKKLLQEHRNKLAARG